MQGVGICPRAPYCTPALKIAYHRSGGFIIRPVRGTMLHFENSVALFNRIRECLGGIGVSCTVGSRNRPGQYI